MSEFSALEKYAAKVLGINLEMKPNENVDPEVLKQWDNSLSKIKEFINNMVNMVSELSSLIETKEPEIDYDKLADKLINNKKFMDKINKK